MSFKVVDTFYVPGVIPTYDELLTKLGAEVEKTFCTTEEELISACSEADAAIAVGIRITPGYVFSAKVIENLNKCRLIALTSIGYDNVDIAAATKKVFVLPMFPIIAWRRSQTTLWHLFSPAPGSFINFFLTLRLGNGVPRRII